MVFFMLFLTSFSSSVTKDSNQIEQVNGVYLGRTGNGFSFNCKTNPKTEKTIVFNEILSVILEMYPLHKDEYLGTRFTVSYIKSNMVLDGTGEEITTVVRLQKI